MQTTALSSLHPCRCISNGVQSIHIPVCLNADIIFRNTVSTMNAISNRLTVVFPVPEVGAVIRNWGIFLIIRT